MEGSRGRRRSQLCGGGRVDGRMGERGPGGRSPPPRRPPAMPLGCPLSHLGRQDAGHHTWASGDRSCETTPCTQHIWKLSEVYFLTHLPESGHLHGRGGCRLEGAQGFLSRGGAVFAPRGAGRWGGERKVGAWSGPMPEAMSSLLWSQWLPGTAVPGRETGPAFLRLGWARLVPSSVVLLPAPVCCLQGAKTPVGSPTGPLPPRGPQDLALSRGVTDPHLFPVFPSALASGSGEREGQRGQSVLVLRGLGLPCRLLSLSSVLQPLCLPLLLPFLLLFSFLFLLSSSLCPHLSAASPGDSLDLVVWARGSRGKRGSAFQPGRRGMRWRRREPVPAGEGIHRGLSAFSGGQSILLLSPPPSAVPGSPFTLSSLRAPTQLRTPP